MSAPNNNGTNTAGASPEETPTSLRPVKDPFIELFLTMHYRKMLRNLNGPQKKNTKYHLIVLLCFLIIIYGFSAYTNTSDSTTENVFEKGYIQITLSITQIILITVWITVAIIITAIFGNSKFVLLLYWMLVYWPLLSIMMSALFGDFNDPDFDDVSWVLYLLIFLEAITVLAWVGTYKVYPKLVTSNWFRQTHARRFWRINLLDDGMTLEYDGWLGRCRKRYACRYVGDTNDAGLPHGRGIWSDDSYNGEVLTGSWENGQPVAPFSSRQYGGKGSTYSAVQIAYFFASDDAFEANKLVPTNDQPPRCGIASVECSTGGEFMTHLPQACLLSGPHVEGENGITVGTVCKELDCGSQTVNPITSLQISADDPRGVQISDHLYASTGSPFTRKISQIVIDVVKTNGGTTNYEAIENNDEETNQEQKSTTNGEGRYNIKLEVNNNWTRIKTKDALIFLPGFNSWPKHSLESFGQLLAMAPKLNQHVYPIIFTWPGAQVLTYRNASAIAASENNRKYFLQMLNSLQAEGINNIHFLSHSLGVQTLMNCFEDNADGTPSPVSQCFGPAPASGDSLASSSTRETGKLICRSITLLNPDFPLRAFREHAFKSIRRVTSLITIVGDLADQALFWSSLINGGVNRFGGSQPSVLDFKGRTSQKCLQELIGKNIDGLYLSKNEAEDNDVVSFQNTELLLQSSVRIGRKKEASNIYLDCDVIDTTGLDTNVNELRHAAYSVNSILLRDIEEIVTTGRRAADRSTLLHKKGNVFEYCHAPSFVTPV
jgi:esterase/lipase superfamily enzyme